LLGPLRPSAAPGIAVMLAVALCSGEAGAQVTPAPRERPVPRVESPRPQAAPPPAGDGSDAASPSAVRSLRRPWPSRGFYVAGELGTLAYVGNIGRASRPGIAFGARVGYDILSFLAAGVRVVGATNATDFAPPPGPATFQSYYYGAEARLAWRLLRNRLSLLAQGGYGLMMLGNNILETAGVVSPGSRFSGAFSAGLGVDYHTKNRHFSVGLSADAVVPQSFGGSAGLAITPYLQYTH
jgi:hypothetical protein